VEKEEANIILARDLNCDKLNVKRMTVVSFLEEEGLPLINIPAMVTYISHNWKSSIHLIFCNLKGINIAYQRTLCCKELYF
jgi:hypothetical protein